MIEELCRFHYLCFWRFSALSLARREAVDYAIDATPHIGAPAPRQSRIPMARTARIGLLLDAPARCRRAYFCKGWLSELKADILKFKIPFHFTMPPGRRRSALSKLPADNSARVTTLGAGY